MKEMIQTYKWPLLGAIIGLILAVMFIGMGFWKTLLIVILIGVGSAAGMYLKDTGILDRGEG